MKQDKASKTLRDILNIISLDVKRLKKLSRETQLNSTDALTLTRYASTLDDITKNTEKEKAKVRQAYENLPVDQLISEYNKLTKGAKE